MSNPSLGFFYLRSQPGGFADGARCVGYGAGLFKGFVKGGVDIFNFEVDVLCVVDDGVI